MAVVKVLTNQGKLIYEANTVIFDLDTHGGVESFESRLYSAVCQAEMVEEPLESQEEEE